MARVFLGLGANLGDRAGTIRAAYSELSKLLEAARLSRLWRSRPLYVEVQPDFINAAVVGDTDLSPRALLAAVNAIEADFGRDRLRERPKGPRNLDIDILLYGSLILAEPDLIIPHAGLNERQFALQPILDLDDGLMDPVSGLAFSKIAEALPPQGIYLLE
ncbi:MAG: 2-amino-4-hydroxy-6-hydroxymethyldihydropteridine diphosphokinase [Rectinemataceae bacterium]